MTDPCAAVELAGIRAAFVASLDAAVPIPVYRSTSPTDPDERRPWLVVEWPPGGQAVGNAIHPDRHRQIVVRIRAVAVDPDTAAGPAPATEDAAQWAADQAARWAAQTLSVDGDGWVVTSARRTSGGGIDRQGRTVNIADDYTLTVSPA